MRATKKFMTEKHRRRIKKQRANKKQLRKQREERRREEEARLIRVRSRVSVWEIERDIQLRRLQNLLVQRLNALSGEQRKVICPLCNLPITVDDATGKNIETITFNRKLVQVHKTCPAEVRGDVQVDF